MLFFMQEINELSEVQIDQIIAHWRKNGYFRGIENAKTIELKREIFLYVRDKAKKGKTGADEKKDWIPKAEREKLTLKRKAEKKAKAAASGAAAAAMAASAASPAPEEKAKV